MIAFPVEPSAIEALVPEGIPMKKETGVSDLPEHAMCQIHS